MAAYFLDAPRGTMVPPSASGCSLRLAAETDVA